MTPAGAINAQVGLMCPTPDTRTLHRHNVRAAACIAAALSRVVCERWQNPAALRPSRTRNRLAASAPV